MLRPTIATAARLRPQYEHTFLFSPWFIKRNGKPISPGCVEGWAQQARWRVRHPQLGKPPRCGCSSATPARASAPPALEPGKMESPRIGVEKTK